MKLIVYTSDLSFVFNMAFHVIIKLQIFITLLHLNNAISINCQLFMEPLSLDDTNFKNTVKVFSINTVLAISEERF